MLNEADRVGVNITNLALQKLLYFAHGIFLIESKRPLVKFFSNLFPTTAKYPSKSARSSDCLLIPYAGMEFSAFTGILKCVET